MGDRGPTTRGVDGTTSPWRLGTSGKMNTTSSVAFAMAAENHGQGIVGRKMGCLSPKT